MNEPTIRDFVLAGALARITQAHYKELRETKTTKEFLNFKFAKAIAEFRRKKA